MPIFALERDYMQELQKYLRGELEIQIEEEKIKISITNLPIENERAISLHYIHNITRAEIAKKLGWSLSKVNQKITRGKNLLRRELNPDYYKPMKVLMDKTTHLLLRK